MMDVVSLVLEFASIFASLLGLTLLLRYRRLLRSMLASNYVIFGFALLVTVLLAHCVLEVLDMEQAWLSSGMHLLWSAGFTAAVVVSIGFSKMLHGHFSLSIPSFQSLVKRLSTMYSLPAAKAILYATGKEAGHDDAARLMKETGLRDEAFVRRIIGICNNLGWGRYEAISLKVGEELCLRVYDCFETTGLSKEAASAITSVCFQSGYFAGVAKALRPNMQCEAKEVRCPLRGDPYCEFTVTFSEAPNEKLRTSA
jgi:predicted hydrocarbon binding protein